MERKTGWVTGALVLMGALLAMPGRAEVAIAGKAGSLGLGLELTAGLSRQWNFRVGANAFDYTDENRRVSQITYDATARLRNATALLDWHPGGRGFRLSGGLVYDDNRIEGSSRPSPSGFYDIGGVPVPTSFITRLDGKIDFDPVVPYVGLGWGNAVAPGSRLRGFLDAGVFFQGRGRAKLTPIIPSGSPINSTPGAREALDILLRREESDIEDDVADYTVYPVVSFGLSYRF